MYKKRLHISYNPLFEEDLLTKIMFVVEDITELERLEEEENKQAKEKGQYVEILQELSNNKNENLQRSL